MQQLHEYGLAVFLPRCRLDQIVEHVEHLLIILVDANLLHTLNGEQEDEIRFHNEM